MQTAPPSDAEVQCQNKSCAVQTISFLQTISVYRPLAPLEVARKPKNWVRVELVVLLLASLRSPVSRGQGRHPLVRCSALSLPLYNGTCLFVAGKSFGPKLGATRATRIVKLPRGPREWNRPRLDVALDELPQLRARALPLLETTQTRATDQEAS